MCDILSAISYGLYPQHHQHIPQPKQHHPEVLRPLKKFKVNMTIPSRPAPPPPQASSTRTANRYSPATNWDDTPFGSSAVVAPVKKAPPPRPPPPKVVPALKKPGQAQSINILSNLFGQKRGGSAKPPVSQKPVLMKLPPPPKLPPPNGYGSLGHHNATTTTNTSELISFDSPPSSPTFTQKSCSDCISVDSFSSDSNYSSPNNGNMSQAESGFEDDFVVTTEHGRRSKVTTPSAPTTISNSSSRDLWDLSDPFGMPPSAGTGSSSNSSTINHYAPVGSATIRVPTVNSKLYETEFVDPLCNGKTVAPKVQTIAKPTIIKTVTAPATFSASSSQKSTPVHQQQHHLALKPKPVLTAPLWSIKPPAIPPASFDDAEEEEESSSLDSLPSLPMPNIPPPPPPVVVDADEVGESVVVGAVPKPEPVHQEQPYGIAMYDFSGETDEDLSFRTNDKIYLLKRLNEEWLLGRDRRGCEGMFPANYIEVRVALPADSHPQTTASGSSSSSYTKSISPVASSFIPPEVRVLYTFNAETADDLTIVENDFVTVLHQINEEWLFGESRGQRGQFPANFIEYVPPHLPLVPPPAN